MLNNRGNIGCGALLLIIIAVIVLGETAKALNIAVTQLVVGFFFVVLLMLLLILSKDKIMNTGNDIKNVITKKLQNNDTMPSIDFSDVSNSENIQQSMMDLDNAIKIDPEDASAYNERGTLNAKSGNYQQAIKDFDQAIRIKPKNACAYNNRGTIKYHLGNNQSAIKDFTKAIEIDPKHSSAYHGRGNVNEKLGNYQQAINDFNNAIEIDPKDRNAYFHRGQVLFFKWGNTQKSLKDFDKAIEIDPELAVAYLARGQVYLELGDNKQARNDFNKVIEISPNDGSARDLLEAMSNMEKALASLDATISMTEQSNGRRQRQGITREVRNAVWNRDGGRCVDCGSNEHLEYDHIIPHSRGGSDTERNIQLLCMNCNRTKHAKI